MNYIKALGDLVKAERIKLGFTQSELAHEMGLSLRTVGDIENYEGNPRFDTLCRVVAYLNLSGDSIFCPNAKKKDNALVTMIRQELSCFTEDDLNVAIKVLEGLREGLHPQDHK